MLDAIVDDEDVLIPPRAYAGRTPVADHGAGQDAAPDDGLARAAVRRWAA